MAADLTQTITHDMPGDRLGNCVATCVAAFLDVPLSDVPHSGFDHDPASPIDDDEAREAFRALRGDLEEAS